MENREIRLINLRKLLKEVVSASALAHAADTSPAYISQILSKKTKGSIGNKLARKLELAMNKPKGWLDQLHDDSETLPVEHIPLIKHEELLSWNFSKGHTQNENVNKIAKDNFPKSGLFGMEVAGDAMVSITNINTSICNGGIAIVDKNKNYACGDIVLVRIKNFIKIRQLIKDGNEQVLKAFNLQYPVIPFTQDVKVLGVVVELRKKIRTVGEILV